MLTCSLTFGGMWRCLRVAVARCAPYRNAVRSGCFCTRGAEQDHAVSGLFSRWQKPPTSRGRL